MCMRKDEAIRVNFAMNYGLNADIYVMAPPGTINLDQVDHHHARRLTGILIKSKQNLNFEKSWKVGNASTSRFYKIDTKFYFNYYV